MTAPPGASTIRLSAASLEAWALSCLGALGVPEADAQGLAGGLVQTSLWGIDSHGIARLTHYLDRLARGSIRARPEIVVTRTGPGTAQVAGGQGLGHVVAQRANQVAMELASVNGIGAVGVSDSSHCGAIGLYTRAAAREGLIGIAFTHTDRIAAPHAGQTPFFGTNPVSIAVPRAGAAPVCLDMATTAIPWNRVVNARLDGSPLPGGVALDGEGRPTTDAAAARALRPLGAPEHGHKGYALALMIELLCGPLHGNAYGPHIVPMYGALDTPRGLGAFFIAVDPRRFAGGATLAETAAGMAAELASEPGQPRMPGDPEQDAEAERRRDGIPVPASQLAEMRAWSARLGVEPPA